MCISLLDNEWNIYTVGEVFSLKKGVLKILVKRMTVRPLQLHFSNINNLEIPNNLKTKLKPSIYSEINSRMNDNI